MSSKLTSHFRGTKSDRRSSTGKGKGKAVARVEGARVHPSALSSDPTRFLRD